MNGPVAQEHRRIAQRQSASINTEEVAAFNSCSAYQDSRLNLLFLSHCVPNPPNKGEKIRAFEILSRLARQYNVHLVCFARRKEELVYAQALEEICASGYAEVLKPLRAAGRALTRFATGSCLNSAYFESRRLRQRVCQLAQETRIDAAFVYTAVMGAYLPGRVPAILDLSGRRLRKNGCNMRWSVGRGSSTELKPTGCAALSANMWPRPPRRC